MKAILYYGTITLACILLACGLIILGIGSWQQTIKLNDYKAAICSIYDFAIFHNPNGDRPNDYDVEIGLVPGDKFMNGANQTDNSMKYRWFIVYTSTNYNTSKQYMIDHYSYDQLVPCYISYVVYNPNQDMETDATNPNREGGDRLVMILDIEMELYYDYTSAIAAICCFGLSFISLAILAIITCWSRRRRHLEYKPIEPIDDFYIIEDPKRKRYDMETPLDLDLVLQSFEEAQRQLWRHKDRLRDHTFDRLKLSQVTALMGEHAVKIKFQKDVHAALSSIGRIRN